MTLPDGPDLTTYSDEELVEERDFLLRSLQDLDAERHAGDVDADDYAVLKDGYTARAAAVLRILDRRRVEVELATTAGAARNVVPTAPGGSATQTPDPAAGTLSPAADTADEADAGAANADPAVARPAAAKPAVVSPAAKASVTARAPRRSRRLRAAVIAVGVVVFAVGAGLLVAHSSGQRLPGQSASGSAPNNKEQQLLVQADAQFQKSDVIGSLKTLQQVLAIDPRNVVALAQEGWVLAISGNSTHDQAIIDRGLGLIRQAESIDGTYAAAHFYAGSVLLNEGNAKGAITEFEDYLADDPSSSTAALVRGDLQTAQAEAAGQLPAGAGPAPTTVPGGSPAPTSTPGAPAATGPAAGSSSATATP
jgi:tetratricopeptide (TPR) repeat protein